MQELNPTRYRNIEIDGLNIFYREAGTRGAPAILLLHGFPASSFMFRNLIPLLAAGYHVIAPDYPGFGYSSFPEKTDFDYAFANYAALVKKFVAKLGLSRYALYIQDYGAPIGLRLALLDPGAVSAIVIQNGNAYAEGLSSEWDPIRDFWRSPSEAKRSVLRNWLDAEGVRLQYTAGMPESQLEFFSPDTWTLDHALLQRTGNIDVQLDLFYDYRTNLDLYPDFQSYFRERQPPVLIVWGRHDPFFTVTGAEAYTRDLPNAELHFLDAGHFALETKLQECADLIGNFLARAVGEKERTAAQDSAE